MSSSRKLIRIDLDEVSDLRYSCHAWVAGSSGYAGGIIRFHGEYRHGSAGAGDALFIEWRIEEFCDVQDPVQIQGLVVDFRDMRYEWGDDLDVPARRLRSMELPVLAVVSPEAKGFFNGPLSEEELRTDFDQAVVEVDEMLRVMKF